MSSKNDPSNPENPGLGKNNTDPIIGEAVGSRLKSLFDEFASEDVPDRFLDLIGQLEQNETTQSTATNDPKDGDDTGQGEAGA